MIEEIEAKQHDRFTLLFDLYKDCGGSKDKAVNLRYLATNRNIKNGVFKAAYQYLLDDGLIRESGTAEYNVSITHQGIKAVEVAINFPDKRSEQFPEFKNMHLK